MTRLNKMAEKGRDQRRSKLDAFYAAGGATRIDATFGTDLPLADVRQEQLDYWASPERSVTALRSWAQLMEIRLASHVYGGRGFQSDLKMYRLVMEHIGNLEAAEAISDAAAKQPVMGIIYFIQGGDRVKIGFTTDLRDRLNALATGSRHPLLVLHQEPGSLADERKFHRRFSHLRAHREWFFYRDELADYIASAMAATT